MRIVYLILFFFVSFSFLFSQSNINADCINAIPLCTTPSFTFNATSGVGTVTDIPSGNNISNPSTNPVSNNAGCLLSGELKPQWLLLTIGNAGFLEFVFGAANSSHPQVGFYDWAMWPYSQTACTNIQNNTLPPIRCNWNASQAGGTGIASASNIPVGGNSGNYEPPLLVNACQQFIICISNYSGVNTLVSFSSIGTASLSCNPNCNPNYLICAGQSATIVPVNFASLTNPSYSIQPLGLTNLTGSFVVSPQITTNYTTYITGNNSLNSVQTITSISTVTVKAQPSAVPTLTQTTCTNTLSSFNLGLSFNPALPAPSYTVLWAPIPNGILSQIQTSASAAIIPGIYSATITSVGGCSTITNFSINPQATVPVFTITPYGNVFTVTCIQPTITITASNQNYNYNWVNGIASPQSGFSANFSATSLGNWSVTASMPNSNCIKTHTFSVTQSTIAPTSTITPLTQLITCTNTAIQTITATCNPTLNIQHQFMAPQGGTVAINSPTAIFTPGPGTYTHFLINLLNGCKTTKTFSVNTSTGFPTFSVVSPQNFTLGCGSRSIISINVPNANTTPLPGGTLTYTLLPPGTGTNYGFNSASNFTNITIPGTWTVIVKDAISNCQTKVPISVIQNTFGPKIEAIVPSQTLTCFKPTVLLQGISETPNVSYNWSFPAPPGNLQGSTITIVTTTNVTNTIVATYTLTIVDLNNTCKSTTTIPIYQNVSPPKVGIAKSRPDITCSSPTVVLTNTSSSTSAVNFPNTEIIQAFVWEGPPPQLNLQVSSTYVGSLPGTYSLTAKDLNNGCVASGTVFIADNRVYPVVNNPTGPSPFVLDCGDLTVRINANYTNPTPDFRYLWLVNPGTSTTSALTTSVLTVNSKGKYRVLVTNISNGCETNAEVTVVSGTLNASMDVNNLTGYAPLEVVFYNNSKSINGLGITSYWNFGNGLNEVTNSSNLSPSTIYNQPGTYTVTLYVNKGNCQASDVKIIKVDIPSKLEIPNVFTPNSDGSNDLFFIKSANLSEIKAIIFDRWGNKIYELKSNTGNIAWDGKNQYGKEVAEGTYFYIITAKGKDGVDYDSKGNVSLFR